MMTLMKIRQKGYEVLNQALGFTGMVRFLQQFELGTGDYTKERQQWLDKLSLDEILLEIKQNRKEN